MRDMENQSSWKTRYFLCSDRHFIGVYCAFEQRVQAFGMWHETEIDAEIFNFVLGLCDSKYAKIDGGAFKIDG